MVSYARLKRVMRKIKSQGLKLQVIEDLEEIRNTTTDLSVMLKEILGLTTRILKVEYAFLLKYDKDETDPFEFLASNDRGIFEDKQLLKEVSQDVIRHRKPVCINLTRHHKRLQSAGVKNIIALPLVFNKDPIGVFMILNKRKKFIKRDLAIFSLIARFSSTAIESIQGYKELENKQKELDVIYSVDRIRDTVKDFNSMMDSILQEISSAIDGKLAYFMLYNKKTNKNELKVSGKLKSSAFVQANANIIHEMSRSTLNNGEMIGFEDLSRDIHNAICTPVIIDEENMGVFGVINSNDKVGFSKLDRTLLNAAAKQADSAVFEDIAKTELKKIFGRYVSPEIMEKMLSEEGKDYMKVKKSELTVLFSDLRGFTALSEKIEAEQLVKILNEHFEAMSRVILKQKGTLDKFVGDEVMALFGAPLYQEAHALKAIKAALDMQAEQAILSKKYAKKGIKLDIGIGINTGDMIVGNIGSEMKTDYTVIGDNVNIAARLCDAAEGKQILITEATYQEVKKSIRVEKLPPMSVKGKSKPLIVYNVIGLA